VQTKFQNKKHQPKHGPIVINYANISTKPTVVNQCVHCNFLPYINLREKHPSLRPIESRGHWSIIHLYDCFGCQYGVGLSAHLSQSSQHTQGSSR